MMLQVRVHNFGLGLVASLLTLNTAFAGVVVYTGPSSEKLMIQDAAKLGKDAFLVKFTGIDSKWSDKVILTKQIHAVSGNRYQFDYNLELSSGVQKKIYQIVVDDGFELKNGSRIPKVELFTQEMPNHEPYKLDRDDAASKAGGIDLIGEYQKNPYKPVVD